MKKILSILLCFVLVFSFVACGAEDNKQNDEIDSNVSLDPDIDNTVSDNSDDMIDVTKPSEENTEPKYDFDDGDLVPAEYRFDVDDVGYELIKSLQGKFQHIENGGTDITFVANNKWYMPSYNDFDEMMQFEINFSQFKFFDNGSVGENIICFTDDELFMFNDEGGYRCNNVSFNTSNDMLVTDDDFDPTIPWVITKDGNQYFVSEWSIEYDEHGSYKQNADGTYNYSLEGKKPLGKVITNGKTTENWDYIEGVDITENVVSIFQIPSHLNGYQVAILTDNGDLYYVGEISVGDTDYDKETYERIVLNYNICTTTHEPIAKNVDKVFIRHDLVLTKPVYSVVGDETALYSTGIGESLLDDSDDVEVKFIIPDGHKASEVVDVFSMYQNAIFIFDNGDVYVTEPISDDAFMLGTAGEFTMTKHDVLSNAIKSDDVKQICSASTMLIDPCIYVLKNDGTLWACNMSDYD